MMEERWTIIISVAAVAFILLLVLNIDRISGDPDIESIMSGLKTDTNFSDSGGTDPGADVRVVAFLDYDCPHCRAQYMQLKQLLSDHGEDVNVVFKHFPLQDTRKAEAAECARAQGVFWKYSDLLFTKDDPNLVDAAVSVGLDSQSFERCLASGEGKAQVMADREEGLLYGVQGTPTMFINDYEFQGTRPYAAIEEFVKNEIS